MNITEIKSLLTRMTFTELSLIKADEPSMTYTFKFRTFNPKGPGVKPTMAAGGTVAIYTLEDVGKIGVSPSNNVVRFIDAGKRTSKQADDSHLSTHSGVSADLEAMYQKAVVSDSKRVPFMKALWTYYNTHKFGSRMRMPKLTTTSKVIGRGMRPSTRGAHQGGPNFTTGQIWINTMMWNARLPFFLEVFLHEMCISGDALIPTDLGLVRMDEIEAVGSRYVMTRTGSARIRKWWKSGDKATLELQTQSGLKLRLTNNHPVLVLTKKCKLSWRNAGELSPGDHVVRVLGNITAEESDVGHAMESLVGIGYLKAATPKFPQSMTPELARLLGYLTAEGSFLEGANPNTIDFANKDQDVIADYLVCWESCFGFVPPVAEYGSTGCQRIAVTRKDLAAWFTAVGFVRAHASEKAVPHSILSSSQEHVIEFLRAFVEGDGSISPRGHIDINCASSVMAQHLSLLFASLGLVTRTYAFTSKHGYKDGETYHRVIVHDGEQAVRIIGAVSTKRKALMANALSYHSEKTLDIPGKHWKIPFVGKFLKSLGTHCRQLAHGGMWPHDLSSILQNVPEEMRARVQKLCGDFVFDKVVSITPTGLIEPVYDMTTSEGQFVANGIVVHNCHQAVWDLDQNADRKEQGHGPAWQKWMVHVGLDPRRFDPTDDYEYKTGVQRTQEEEKWTDMYGPRVDASYFKKLHKMETFVKGPAILERKGRALTGTLEKVGSAYEFMFRHHYTGQTLIMSWKNLNSFNQDALPNLYYAPRG